MKIKIFRTDYWEDFDKWLEEYKQDPDNIYYDWILEDPYIDRYHERITIKGHTHSHRNFFGEELSYFNYFGAIFENGTYWYNDKSFTGLSHQQLEKYAAELEQCLKNNTGKYGGSDDYVELDDIVF